jgi:hypothetical protein
MSYTASPATIDHIAALVVQACPKWDRLTVRVVLQSHAHEVDGNDLAIAALRCAVDPKMPGPKAIGWRGPHWHGLGTTPPNAAPRPICSICRKPEHRCYSERKGIDDDHAFEPLDPIGSRR